MTAMRTSWRVFALSGITAGAVLLALPIDPAVGQSEPSGDSAETAKLPDVPDYVAFTQRIPSGLVNVAAHDLPEAFLKRVSDRSLRSHFRQLYRIVEPGDPVNALFNPPIEPTPPAEHVRTLRPAIDQEVFENWSSARNEVPELRGFRMPYRESAARDIPWQMHAPARDVDRTTRAAALHVAERLARDGLVRTTLDVMRTKDIIPKGVPSIDMNRLASVGIPVDLLRMFVAHDKPFMDALDAWWISGGNADDAEALIQTSRLAFQATRSGFTVSASDGTVETAMLRLQAPMAKFVSQPGDGSPLDVIRQLAQLKRNWRVIISTHERELEALHALTCTWELGMPSGQCVIVSTPGSVTQWAQDNARTGIAPGADGAPVPVTLMPRFASINEQITKCLVGDSFVFETLREQIGELAPSPLHFQGGNMLCATMPASGERVLLIGEAEVHRNRALGLSEQQILEAFRLEFGVDRCEIMPAVSFHLDVELSLRRNGDALMAFVPDDVAAARLILRSALMAFANHRLLALDEVNPALESMEQGDVRPSLALLAKVVGAHITEQGNFGGAMRDALRTGPLDAPEAALGRVLHVMDLLAALFARELGQSTSPTFTHEATYRDSLLARLDERNALADRCSALGMQVVRVPSLVDEELGVSALNVLQLPDAMLVPVMGGFYSALDQAAIDAYARAVGEGVTIVPITTTAIQANYGGVHCMVSAYEARK